MKDQGAFVKVACVADTGAVPNACSRQFYTEHIQGKECEMRPMQPIDGRALQNASGGRMVVLGVCEIRVYLTEICSATIRLLVFEQLACNILVGKHQLRQWRCKINFEKDVMELNQQVLDDMTGPVTIKLLRSPRPDG